MGMSPRRWARISSYMTELFSRIMTSSIAITGTSARIMRRSALANAGETSERTNRIVSCSVVRSFISIYLSCFQREVSSRTGRTLFKADEFYEDFERNYPNSIMIVALGTARRVPGLASHHSARSHTGKMKEGPLQFRLIMID